MMLKDPKYKKYLIKRKKRVSSGGQPSDKSQLSEKAQENIDDVVAQRFKSLQNGK